MSTFTIVFDCETDGRFIAEIGEIPGALACGATMYEAKAKVQALTVHALPWPNALSTIIRCHNNIE